MALLITMVELLGIVALTLAGLNKNLGTVGSNVVYITIPMLIFIIPFYVGLFKCRFNSTHIIHHA